jgi:predicted nucleic acid-binding protein
MEHPAEEREKNVTDNFSKRVVESVQSDWLPQLHRFATQIPELAPFIEDYLRINLVIDANFVQQELQWRLKRRKPEARTKLNESASSGVVALFAPTHLVKEIEDDLQEIATRVGCTVQQARGEWETFRQQLHLYTPRTPKLRVGLTVVDPDDLPYIAACDDLAAHAVYSRDKHLRQMEAPVISVAIDASLQSYARASSVRLAFMVGSAFSVRLSVEGIKAVAGAVVKVYGGFKRLHPALQMAIVGGLVYVFVDEKLRTRLLGFLKRMGQAAAPLFDALAIAAEQFQITEVTLQTAKKEIVVVLPVRQRMPVVARARRICLVSSQPVPLRELERRIVADGHNTNSAHFGSYLRRVLRSSGEFVETSAGWRLLIQKQ